MKKTLSKVLRDQSKQRGTLIKSVPITHIKYE